MILNRDRGHNAIALNAQRRADNGRSPCACSAVTGLGQWLI